MSDKKIVVIGIIICFMCGVILWNIEECSTNRNDYEKAAGMINAGLNVVGLGR